MPATFQLGEETLEEEDHDTTQLEEDSCPDNHQRSKEIITIGDQRIEEDFMGIISWCNDPRRSNRIAQSPPDPNFEGMMNFNLPFVLRN